MSLSYRKIVALALVVSFTACEPYEARLPTTGATLEGTIKYGDATVAIAQIMVLSEKSQAIGQIEEDGRYRVENAPLGAVKIGVNTDAMRGELISRQMAASYKGPGKGGSRAPPPKFVSVPAKYWEPDTSGVTTTVKRGKNEFDIVLTPAGK